MTQHSSGKTVETSKDWFRIPDGTKVRHRLDATEGVIDGLTEIVSGSNLNADEKTQYRVRMPGTAGVRLVPEQELLFMTDQEKLVMILKQSVGYRSYVTERLHSLYNKDRFVP